MQYVDVFTGIGGIGLALSSYMTPLLYCEYDKFCQQVLVSRMRDGDIEKAPIHGDIKTLHLSASLKPVLIAGGFPCQDISTAGNQLGMAGSRSSLFFEIMRLVDENPSVQILFLENVANIVKCGMEEVVIELRKRHFDLYWTTRAASAHGAPHQRARWFCLAVRGDVSCHLDEIDRIEFEEKEKDNEKKERRILGTWETEWTPRITFRPPTSDESWDESWIHRSHTLGNTVVPIVVRSAFLELVCLCKNTRLLSDSLSSYATDASSLAYPFPEAGFVSGERFYPMPKALPIIKPGQIDITILMPGQSTPVKMLSYPTPRRGITHHSQLTDRSIHDLPTVLVHSTVSHAYQRSLGFEPGDKAVIANVNYIEWMMGYPKDWTRVSEALLSSSGLNDGSPINPKQMNKKNQKEKVKKIDEGEQGDGGENDIEENGEGEGEGDDIISELKKGKIKVNHVSPNSKSKQNNANENKKKRRSANGLHLFMNENPGQELSVSLNNWRHLSPESKAAYARRARESNANGNRIERVLLE
jgi:DNA (cytosine-5)-methyltransferase 1